MAEQGWTTADFAFDLPDAQIAQHPSAERGASRMLVVDRGAGVDAIPGDATRTADWVGATHASPLQNPRPDAPAGIRDSRFSDLLALIPAGDLLVRNSTKVRHARFLGTRPSGQGVAEVLLIHPAPDDSWIAMGKPGSAMRPGKQIRLGDDAAI